MINIIRNKLSLIYTSNRTYCILGMEVIFLAMYMRLNQLYHMMDYIGFLKNDIFLWILFIPLSIVIHRYSIFTISFNYTSRFMNKKKLIICDFIVILFSTIAISLLVILLPIAITMLLDSAFLQTYNKVVLANVVFLLVRYLLLAIFMQWIVYMLMLDFQALQKFSNGLCFIPIAIFFVITFPLEFISANSGGYIPYLDFTAGKYYQVINENSIDWLNVLIHNVHIMAYMVVFTWLSIDYFSRKVEFSEDENKSD